jgi:hypothetical protein
MRRILFLVATVCLLLLTTAGTALAAPPIRESGTYSYGYGDATNCDQVGPNQTCETTFIYFDQSADFSFLCVDRYKYLVTARGQFRLLSYESGCTDAATITIEDDLDATVSGTVQLYDCRGRTCRPGDTVTVSASFDAGETVSYSGRGSFREDGCMFRYSFRGERADAVLTLTIDGTTLSGTGFVASEDYTFTSNC